MGEEDVEEICGTCFYGLDMREAIGGKIGECCRFPPVATPEYYHRGIEGPRDIKFTYGRPEVYGDDFCGEWRKK